MATKLVKNYFMVIVAMVMVVGFSAFRIIEHNKTDDPELETWYFTGSSSGGTAIPNQYSDDEEHASDCGGTPVYVCEILAPRNSSDEPDLDAHIDPEDEDSPTILELINEAMTTKQPNAVVQSFKEL